MIGVVYAVISYLQDKKSDKEFGVIGAVKQPIQICCALCVSCLQDKKSDKEFGVQV
jgi:hypothetical protein